MFNEFIDFVREYMAQKKIYLYTSQNLLVMKKNT